MFRRRNPLTVYEHVTGAIWPRIGWKRAGIYVYHRVLRLPGSGHAVAAGVAWGAAISFTPMVGMHFALAAACAWIMRGSIVGSLFGTFLGNPWTFPVIWILTLETGNLLLGNDLSVAGPAVFFELYRNLVGSMLTLDWQLFVDQVWPLWGPMLLGSLPWGVVAWFATYLTVVRVGTLYKARAAARRAAKAEGRRKRRLKLPRRKKEVSP